MSTTFAYDTCLAFTDGSLFFGFSCGKKGVAVAEVCFTTSPLGYQHVITDPSFFGQIILFTSPHIGNIGINSQDNECHKVFARGVVLREDPVDFSHHYRIEHFSDWLVRNQVVGICGVDTRAITRLICRTGSKNGIIFPIDEISHTGALELLKASKEMNNLELSAGVLGYSNYDLPTDPEKKKVCIIDFGIKHGIIRNLQKYFTVVVIAGKRGFADVVLSSSFDGIVLSNGPGDPSATYEYLYEDFTKIFSSDIPILGICLGHQIIVLAFGCRTKKMLVGHRGANHPVMNLITGKVEITSQNHGFVLDESTLTRDVGITHRSLFDNSVEGVKIKNKKIHSIQYHPEGSPGPHDSHYIFEDFFHEVVSD
ncbi:carbamoyl-phosphate synthase, small subunit [Neorickettsia helminthoeca str. Oregon]|uniref:Carbamoyl phosphate synthase small chain n=1 Tax=Neorickettsia helminthoeca str. Oregon TaxID=1286528 RepID=X5H401_9RICK|nr:glutamine-hydrolyzing carbamoyl-phosphate synthase small subunit [Neorickettsia helminthoeca]AHX11418.1 carbamoyl-phosphate synthase, small subunit [Neorickettsia helminthoeca str. Oregon]